ncbi:MAG: macro domain-containing protein [Candidatus Thermoplasmatota archaeon]|nr:macro domain-containing protein [Candidatus Thermoplasmatota archaeon]
MDGNIFNTPAKAYVNTVNTKGVMGKGIAKVFKEMYPKMFKEYQRKCETGELDIGKLWSYHAKDKIVINFPTKEHWRRPSKADYIEAGLLDFSKKYAIWGLESVAFPPLGCGNGGLDFETQVKPLMEKYLQPLPINILVYPHKGKDDDPEHFDIEKMKDWLRSEPASMPFSEVWEDLIKGIKRSPTIRFPDRTSYLSINDSDNESEKYIEMKNGVVTQIYFEDLRVIWNAVRENGFLLSRDFPYSLLHVKEEIVHLFTLLNYVLPFEGAISIKGNILSEKGFKLKSEVISPQLSLYSFA